MDQLSKDLVAAQKAGMSYGKYMAMKERPAPKKQIKRKSAAPILEKRRICRWCGKELQKGCKVYCQHEAQKTLYLGRRK